MMKKLIALTKLKAHLRLINKFLLLTAFMFPNVINFSHRLPNQSIKLQNATCASVQHIKKKQRINVRETPENQKEREKIINYDAKRWAKKGKKNLHSELLRSQQKRISPKQIKKKKGGDAKRILKAKS